MSKIQFNQNLKRSYVPPLQKQQAGPKSVANGMLLAERVNTSWLAPISRHVAKPIKWTYTELV